MVRFGPVSRSEIPEHSREMGPGFSFHGKSSNLFVDQVIHDIRSGLMGLNASKYSDAVLKTPDEQSIYVCRALLAVRSSFFATLFFSDFAEHKETSVSISIPSKPLKHVVEFAYTGESTLVHSVNSCISEYIPHKSNQNVSSAGFRPPLFGGVFQSDTPSYSATSTPRQLNLKRKIHRTEVTDLIELAHAADYCDMPALKGWCYKTLDSLIRSRKETACTALEALSTNVWDHDGDIMTRQNLLQFIADNSESCLLVPDCKDDPTHVSFNIGDCMGALELSAINLNELLTVAMTREGTEKRSSRSLRSEYLFLVIYFWGSNGLLPMKDEWMSDSKSKESPSGLWHAVTNEPIEKLKENGAGLFEKAKSIRQEQLGPRWSSAKAMVRHLDLTRMRSTFLRDYVEKSGLLSQQCVLTAYRHHATRNECLLLDNGYLINSKGDIVKNDNPFGIVPA